MTKLILAALTILVVPLAAGCEDKDTNNPCPGTYRCMGAAEKERKLT